MAVKYSVVQQKYEITGNGILKFYTKAQSVIWPYLLNGFDVTLQPLHSCSF
jgi:hypothetical protein